MKILNTAQTHGKTCDKIWTKYKMGESILFLKTERDANTCRNWGFAPKWNSQITSIVGQKVEKLHTQYLTDDG